MYKIEQKIHQIKTIRIKQLWDTCVRFQLKHERMHFIPFNLTKESGLSATEYITIQTNCTYDWHLTNLHSRASKGNKIMRKLQGKWVLVPHGELKLIICDNLSASENSNMSTKLHEPQKRAGKKNDKRKGEGKEKGAVRDIICACKESTSRLAERQMLLMPVSLISTYSTVLHLFVVSLDDTLQYLRQL